MRLNALEDAAQLKLTVDRLEAQALGLPVNDIYSAIQLMLDRSTSTTTSPMAA